MHVDDIASVGCAIRTCALEEQIAAKQAAGKAVVVVIGDDALFLNTKDRLAAKTGLASNIELIHVNPASAGLKDFKGHFEKSAGKIVAYNVDTPIDSPRVSNGLAEFDAIAADALKLTPKVADATQKPADLYADNTASIVDSVGKVDTSSSYKPGVVNIPTLRL